MNIIFRMPLLLLYFGSQSCNTVAGLGKDMAGFGRVMTNTAEHRYLHNTFRPAKRRTTTTRVR